MPRDHEQDRWPRGTPVAPGGHGPGGGRFRDATSTLAAGDLGSYHVSGYDWAARLVGRVTGDAHLLGEWRRVDPAEHVEERRAGLTRAILGDGMTPREAAQVVREMMAGVLPPRAVHTNGPHEVVFETDLDVPERELLAFLDRLLAVSPVAKSRLSITPDMPRATGGLTLRDEEDGVTQAPILFVTESVFRAPEHVLATLPARKMPAAKASEAWQYILAHEWGHVLTNGDRGRHLYDGYRDSLSSYSASNPAEFAADAFAEWFLSGGRSRNPAVRAYAELYGWAM